MTVSDSRLDGRILTRMGLLCASVLLFKTGAVLPQDTSYVPNKELPNGRQVVAIYFGAGWCQPCVMPNMKAAIRHMKPLVAAQAKDSGAGFSAIVAAFDRDLDSGLAFVRPLGAFDEYSFGNDITSLVAERFIWGDSLAMKGVPSIIVFERTVRWAPHEPILFSPPHVLVRAAGDSILAWVHAGARIWRPQR
jgi:thiol-disulfide isomerase/thioredoxin